MNYIYWFDTTPANGAEYINLCRRKGEPLVLRFCSLHPAEFADSFAALQSVLEQTPRTLDAVVVNAPLDITARIYQMVAGRVPVLCRVTANPFRAPRLEALGDTSHFSGFWMHYTELSLDGVLPMAHSEERLMVWFSSRELTARQEESLRRIYGKLTIVHCDRADERFFTLIKQADLVSTDLPASWTALVRKQTSAEFIYPVCDEHGVFSGWRTATEFRVLTESLPVLRSPVRVA